MLLFRVCLLRSFHAPMGAARKPSPGGPSNTNRSSVLLRCCWGKETITHSASSLWEATTIFPCVLWISYSPSKCIFKKNMSIYVGLTHLHFDDKFLLVLPHANKLSLCYARLYPLTATLRTRAASPPLMTKTCTTTRTSGTCESFMTSFYMGNCM